MSQPTPRPASLRRRGWLALAPCLAVCASLRCPEATFCTPAAPVALPSPLQGFSQNPADGVAIALEIGANAIRPGLSWRGLESTVAAEGLVLDDVADAGAVAAWAAGRDWSGFDARVAEWLGAGLYPIPIVGHGFSSTLPRLDGEPATPDRLGREEYLARQYRTTRATVERYDGDGVDDAPGSPRIELWQIENELNQAMFTAVFGWRDPTLLGALTSAWADIGFLTRLIETLARAVKDADPTALTTTNFHSDVPPEINARFDQPPWWGLIGPWSRHLDVVGLDAYPNYYRARPVRGDRVGERVALVRGHACGRPVIVAETGYPTGPAEAGFDEAGQALYLEQAWTSAHAAGADGFLWFGARTSDGHSVAITPEDLDNLAFLADLFETGDVDALLSFVFENYAYVAGHFGEVIQAVEGYWGIVRPDGSHKPAWDVYEDALRP